jgi:hypothetical protein
MTIAARILVAGALSCLLGIAATPAASASNPLIAQSPGFAGYNATAPSAITMFSGSIKMPTVTCPLTGGPSSFGANVEIQDTSGNIAAFTVGGQCSPMNGGPPTISPASIQLVSNFSPSLDAGASVGVVAGQTIHATITEHATTGFTSLTITNPTTRASGSASTPLVPSFTGVQAGLQQFSLSGPGTSFTPIPTFTMFSFIGLKFNGATLATLNPTESEMYDGSTLQVATSAIAAGGTFNTIFKHV